MENIEQNIDVNQTEIETLANSVVKEKKNILTISLLFLAGVLIFFFLVSGTLTDNRFGSHLVMSADLTASPMWYGLTMTYISFALIIIAIILFIFDQRGQLNISEDKLRVIRLGSLFLMGISAFFIALSSITFAVFNNDFFTNHVNNEWRSLVEINNLGNITSTTKWATQGVAIASLSIIFIVGIIATTIFFLFRKKEVSNKFYYSVRNGAVLLSALGWLVFNINLMAFGAMGGDAGILINGVLGTDFNWNDLGSTLGDISAEDFYTNVLRKVDDSLPGWTISRKWFTEIWDTGSTSIIGIGDISIGFPLGAFIHNSGDWVANLSKDSFLLGVNESFPASFIMLILLLGFVMVPAYIYIDYKNFDDNRISITYYAAVITLVTITIIFLSLAWIAPYIITWDGDYNPLLDGLIAGDPAGIAPGLIGQAGTAGGINGAIIYFSPNYSGTICWWIALVVVILTPFVAGGFSAWKHWDTLKTNKIKIKLIEYEKEVINE
ncbi:MAG: hypothetical protein TYPL_0240 [Candidatus Tyloplasma litorale]|nr:MAG: hypothetical protein TYPL_0240 [Mycoplasmatales bacterium]